MWLQKAFGNIKLQKNLFNLSVCLTVGPKTQPFWIYLTLHTKQLSSIHLLKSRSKRRKNEKLYTGDVHAPAWGTAMKTLENCVCILCWGTSGQHMTEGEEILSRADVQSGGRRARHWAGKGRESDGEGQQRANPESPWHLTYFMVNFKYFLLGQFFSCDRFSLQGCWLLTYDLCLFQHIKNIQNICCLGE